MPFVRKWHCAFVGEPLNHIHQDTKSARLIAVSKRTFKIFLPRGTARLDISKYRNAFLDQRR